MRYKSDLLIPYKPLTLIVGENPVSTITIDDVYTYPFLRNVTESDNFLVALNKRGINNIEELKSLNNLYATLLKVSCGNRNMTFTFSREIEPHTEIPLQIAKISRNAQCSSIITASGSTSDNNLFIQSTEPAALRPVERGIWINTNNGLIFYWDNINNKWTETYAVYGGNDA